MTFTNLFNIIEGYVSVGDLALYEVIIVAVVVVLFCGWYYGGGSYITNYFDYDDE